MVGNGVKFFFIHPLAKHWITTIITTMNIYSANNIFSALVALATASLCLLP